MWRAVRKSDQTVFALKQVPLTGLKRHEREEAIDEARMLSRLASPYVIQYLDSFVEADTLNILMEYASGGTVHSLLRRDGSKPKALAESEIWPLFLRSLAGLAHVHRAKIIHRDIKSLNLFLDGKGRVKLGDLGVARALSHESNFARTIVGTPYYLSPELCEDKPYNERSDIWALGVVLYEMMTGQHPFNAQNEGALIRKIMRGVYDTPPPHFSASLREILKLCLTFSPVQRPTSALLMNHAVIRTKAKELDIDLYATLPEASSSSSSTAAAAAAAAANRENPSGNKYVQHPIQMRPGAIPEAPRPAGKGNLAPEAVNMDDIPHRDAYLAAHAGNRGRGRDRDRDREVEDLRRRVAELEAERRREAEHAAARAAPAAGRPNPVRPDLGAVVAPYRDALAELPREGSAPRSRVPDAPPPPPHLDARRSMRIEQAPPAGGPTRRDADGGVAGVMGGGGGGGGRIGGDPTGYSARHPVGRAGPGRYHPGDIPAEQLARPAGRPGSAVGGGVAAALGTAAKQGEWHRRPLAEEEARAAQLYTAAAMMYETPTFARRTATDLMAANPHARATGLTSATSGRSGARYGGAIYEPTVVSTTTAATTRAPRPF